MSGESIRRRQDHLNMNARDLKTVRITLSFVVMAGAVLHALGALLFGSSGMLLAFICALSTVGVAFLVAEFRQRQLEAAETPSQTAAE